MKLTTLTLSIAILFSLAVFSTVSAKENNAVKINAIANTENRNQDNDRNENDSDDIRSSTSTQKTKDNDAQFNAEEHRNTMASFMKNMLTVADREDGIGSRVREIAREQNASGSTTAHAMDNVEHRGSAKKFFLGSDYKNLGVIRSEIASTTNNISQLKNLLDRTTNIADRALLDEQIKTLEAEQVKMNAYLKMHEDSFSMFGWFMRIFTK